MPLVANAAEQPDLLFRMVDQAPIGMYVVDSDFLLQQVNCHAAPVFAAVPYLGRDFAEVTTELWGPEIGSNVVKVFRHTLETGEKYVSPPFSERRQDLGVRETYEWETQRIELNDGRHCVVCYFQNVTQRVNTERALRDSDARFRALADNIPQMAWIADAGTDGQVHWFNRNWYEYTGTTFEEMQGIGWHSVHHPDHSRRVIERFAYHVQQGLDWEDTFPLKGKDGSFRWFLSRMKCIRDANGTVVQIFGTNTDITAERQMAEEMRMLTARLSETDRLKDEFLATLAHELRNPLAPISNAIQVMRMADDLDEGISELLDVMERQTSHLIRLVDDLLDVSRISRGKIELRLERISLRQILQTAIEIARPKIDELQHQLTWVDNAAGIELLADPVRLSQVIANLLMNSSKYMDRGGQIFLEVHRNPGTAVISVRDIGVGIPTEMLQKVFDMFVQIEQIRPQANGGLGIGLALSKKLVEMHSGQISAHSDGPGKGCLFEVTLPILEECNKSDMSEDGELDKAALGAANLATMVVPRRKLIVVDDMRVARATLETLLARMGQHVLSVENGQSAFDAAISDPPDILISDIGMPEMDGYELARKIRAEPSLNKVMLVALTGYGQSADQRQAKEAGFDWHLTKPASFEDLREMLLRELR